jgi:uncharacterized protein YdeI (YjbR/CyaY-like superfamily)
MASVIDTYSRTQPAGRSAWRTWLKAHHASAKGVWLVYRKRSAGTRSLTYDAAVQEALCYGWIDSVLRSLDDRRFMQLFTPRRPGSTWSALNKRRVKLLLSSGRMAEPGLAKIRAAKRDGSWNALTSIDRLTVPADLRKALASAPKARQAFSDTSPSRKKAILWFIVSAKKPETRAARIRRIVDSARSGRDLLGTSGGS